MAIAKEEVMQLFEELPDDAKQSAYEFLLFLSTRHTRPDWPEIANMQPDDLPLSKEEERQLNSHSGYVSWEEAMNELHLPSDTKP